MKLDISCEYRRTKPMRFPEQVDAMPCKYKAMPVCTNSEKADSLQIPERSFLIENLLVCIDCKHREPEG